MSVLGKSNTLCNQNKWIRTCLFRRDGEIYTNNTRNTPEKKIINCGQATKDGWIGEGEARIVLLAFGRRMNNSFRRGCHHNTLQRLAPVAHETLLERLDPIIIWHSPSSFPKSDLQAREP
jgi:hypothetical protein